MEKHLHLNIDTICKRWGWGRDKFGERMGVGRGAVYNWTKNNSEPSISAMIKMERLTGLPAGRLYYERLNIMDIPEHPQPVRPDDLPWIVAEPAAEYRTKMVQPNNELVQVSVDVSGLVAELERIKVVVAELQTRLEK